jgi:4-amino-4-deoxy-L-arabinose transferase-like glycosyltransferase
VSAPDVRDDARTWRAAVGIVAAAAAVRLAFAAAIPLFPDEAYYWDWSRHLAAGYFDHPPAIALLIRLGGVLLAPFGASATPLGVRLGPVIAGFVASLATIGVARRVAGAAAALTGAVIMSVLPLAAAGLLLATPDSPVLAALAVTLYCLTRALQSAAGSRASLGWWLATGVALGAAFCSKYTSIFLPVAVFGAVLWRPDLRPRLREPGPYAACVIATLAFLPTLLWNAHHGWISFGFQLRHGLAAPRGSALMAAWKHEGDFFGGQAGLASPILFVLLCIATARALRRRARGEEFVLGAVAALTFCFFIYSGIRQRVEPNWPSPAYVPAIALLACWPVGRAARRWLRAGIGLAALMSIVIYVQAITPILPLAPARDPIARAFGWREVVAAADSVAAATTRTTGHHTWTGGDRYQEAAALAFYDPAHPSTFATNVDGRDNQYDLWPRFGDRAPLGDNLVLLLDDNAADSTSAPAAIAALTPYFGAVERGPAESLRRGARVVARRRIWILLQQRPTDR